MVRDLSDKTQLQRQLASRQRRMQAATRQQSMAVDRGAFRVKSEEGLEVGTAEDPTGSQIVYGTLVIVGTLRGDGSVEWQGPVKLSGDTIVDGDFTIIAPGIFKIGNTLVIDPAHSTTGAQLEFGQNGRTTLYGDDEYVQLTQLNSSGTAVAWVRTGTTGDFTGVELMGGVRMPAIGPKPAGVAGQYMIYGEDGGVYYGASGGDGGGDTPPQLNPEGYIWPADPALYGISDTYAAHVARGSAEPGVDVMTPVGAAAYAPADGTVVAVNASPTGATGRYVTIRTTENAWFRLLHLSSVAVSAGDAITQGQILGRTGGSGYGSEAHYGPHLHITFWSGPSSTQPSFDATEDFQAYMAAQAAA